MSASSLLNETGQKVKDAGKQLDKSVKKRIKKKSNTLRKLVDKCRLDKVTETEINDMRSEKSQLENLVSGAFGSEQ